MKLYVWLTACMLSSYTSLAAEQKQPPLPLDSRSYSQVVESALENTIERLGAQPTPNHYGYSEKYQDEHYEYRHVAIIGSFRKRIQFAENHLMSEREWRSFGIQQSPGWQHYMIFAENPWLVPFRRPLRNQN